MPKKAVLHIAKADEIDYNKKAKFVEQMLKNRLIKQAAKDETDTDKGDLL